MNMEDVVWDHKLTTNTEWSHAAFDGGDLGDSAYVGRHISGYYRLFRELMADGEDMTPLEFKCWLQDKRQVPFGRP